MLSTRELLCLAGCVLFTSYNHISTMCDYPMSYDVVVERGKAFLNFLYMDICVTILFHLSLQLLSQLCGISLFF